jgi:hypothetical protein
MTILSLKEAALGAESGMIRAICTRIRTGVASGKNRANPATMLACGLRAVAMADCAKR